MRVFIESKVKEDPSRGPGKFIHRLIPALGKIGVECRFDNIRSCNLSLALSWWPQKNLGMPRVVRVDGLTIPSGGKIGAGYIAGLAKNINGSTAIIWQSLFSKRIVGSILGVKAKHEFVIPNGMEPVGAIKPAGDGKYKHVIMASNWLKSSGGTRKIKRLKTMIDVAREFAVGRPDVIFWVAGKTNYSHIKHPNLRFLGQLPNEALLRYLYSANCCLFLGCYDACPNSVIEPLVIGTPVICVNGSGPEELVRLGYGEVLHIDATPTPTAMATGQIAPVDAEAVKAALRRWVDCADKRPAKALFIDETARQYKAAFEKVLTNT